MMIDKPLRMPKGFSIVRPGAVETSFWNNVPFKLPQDAQSPQIVAEAILAHHQAEADGDLSL